MKKMKWKLRKALAMILSLVLLVQVSAESVYAEAEGENPSPLTLGQYRLEFDDASYDEEGVRKPHAFVKVGETSVGSGVPQTFTAGTISWTLEPPVWRQDDTPVVEIEVLNEGETPVVFYRSDLPEGDPYRLSLVDKVCTFTPASDTPFIVRVWWSAYDAFGPEEGYRMLEVSNLGGNGRVSLDNSGLQPSEGKFLLDGENGSGKYQFADTDLANGASAIVRFEGEIEFINLNGQEYRRGSEAYPLDHIVTPVGGKENTYQFIVNGSTFGEDNYFRLEVQFTDNGQNPPGPEDGHDISIDWNGAENGSASFAGSLPGGVTTTNAGRLGLHVGEGVTGTFRLNLIPETGKNVARVEVDGSEKAFAEDENGCYYLIDLATDRSIYITFENAEGGDNPPGPGEGGENPPGPGEGEDNPPGPEDSDPAVAIPAHEYAYFVDTTVDTTAEDALDRMKGYLATEIWHEFFNPDTGRPFAGKYDGITNLEGLQAVLSLQPLSSEKDAAAKLYYYEYKLTLSETEVVSGKVYVLPTKDDFVVKTVDEAGASYHVVTITYYYVDSEDDPGRQNQFSNDVYVRGNVKDWIVFGNGVCSIGTLDTGSETSVAAHITQEHSGLGENEPFKNLDCRLIICNDEFDGVKISADRDAAAWNFTNVGVYATSDESSTAPVAEVYYGSESISLKAVQYTDETENKTVAEMTLDTTKLSSDAVSIRKSGSEFVIDFHTGYDEIPLIVTYDDGTVGYMTLHRVGLSVGHEEVTQNKYKVWHGTDHTVEYTVADFADGKAVYATFYYTGDTEPAERVNLFTTVTMSEGVTRKIVADSITQSGRIISGERLGYASQGSDRYYDDFLIWSGTDSEFEALEKIETIVYTPGSEDSFGGVKIGSGAGVTWEKQ